MLRGYLYRLIEACAFEDDKACYPFLGFGEWPSVFRTLPFRWRTVIA